MSGDETECPRGASADRLRHRQAPKRELMTVNRRTTIVLVVISVILVAVFGITRWQRARATQVLLDKLAGDDYGKVQDAMTQLRDRGAAIVPDLLEKLQSPEPAAKWRAASLLGDVGGRRVWEPLMGALNDESTDVRAAAAVALGKLDAKDAVGPLASIVADTEADVNLRISAAEALALLADEAAVASLAQVLADHPPVLPPEPEVDPDEEAAEDAEPAEPPPPDTTELLRVRSARALGAIGTGECIAPLVQAAAETIEPSAEVRTAAAYALGDVARRAPSGEHGTDLIRGLVGLQEDTVGDVRAAAIHSLGFATVTKEQEPVVTAAIKAGVADDFYWAREAARKSAKALNVVVVDA